MHEPGRYDASRATLVAYLCGVARNQVRRYLDRERPYVPLAEEPQADDGMIGAPFISGDDPLGNCTRNQLVQFVRQAVLALPPRYREVVVLCDFQEMSYAEAATVLDCAIGTVNSRLYRGHALLLRKLRAAGKLDAASTNAQWMRCFV
jgi:RNA polymerase sigma-70 factor (ECF subfamily)